MTKLPVSIVAEPAPDPAHTARLADPQRLQALNDLDVMSAEGDPVHERSVRLASRILGVPVSLVSYLNAERQHFRAQTGLCGWAARERGTPLSHSFCQYVVSTGEPLMVADARENPLLADNGAVADLNVIAYLGVPVRAPTGEVLGSFCVIDSMPRAWTQDDLDALSDLVSMLEAELTLRHTLRERDVILQEMNHRIRNLFSLIGGMVRIDRRAATSAHDLAESITRRLEALNAAHQMIVPVVEAQARFGIGAPLGDLMAKLLLPYESENRIALSGADVAVGPKAVVYMTLALHELATNSAKYGALSADHGRLDIAWQVVGEALHMEWVETGHAWTQIDTRGSGFGSRLLLISVQDQLGGTLETEAQPDRFTHRLTLPLARLAG